MTPAICCAYAPLAERRCEPPLTGAVLDTPMLSVTRSVHVFRTLTRTTSTDDSTTGARTEPPQLKDS